MKNIINIAVVQHECTNHFNDNIDKSVSGIHKAKELNADIVLLPELSSLNYFCVSEDPDNFDLAEPIDGLTTDNLSRIARENEIIIVTTIFERRSTGLYHNTAVVLDKNGHIAGTYRKMHIPDDPGYHEKYYFTPGDQGFIPIETSVAKLGVMVCWDQWFPEAARLMSLAKADILLFPSAIGWDKNDSEDEQIRQRDAWITIQKSHAVANCLPVVISNRIGHEKDPTNRTKGIDFWGSSFITGPQGEILAEAAIDETTVINTSLNMKTTENVRRDWPFFRDRRVDVYQGLDKHSSELLKF